jgi:hypothetical protein
MVHAGSGSGGVGAGGGFRNDSLSSEQSSSMDMTSCPTAVMRGSSGAPMMMMMPGGNNKKHKRSGSGKKAHAPYSSSTASQQQSVTTSRHLQQSQNQQQSFSSSDDDLRSTPECTSCEEHDSEKGKYRQPFALRCVKYINACLTFISLQLQHIPKRRST